MYMYDKYLIYLPSLSFALITTGRTNSSGALRLAHQQLGQNAGDRPEVPNVVLFITDGADNVDEEFFIGEVSGWSEWKRLKWLYLCLIEKARA